MVAHFLQTQSAATMFFHRGWVDNEVLSDWIIIANFEVSINY